METLNAKQERLTDGIYTRIDEVRAQIGPDNDEAFYVLDRIEDLVRELELDVIDEYKLALIRIQEVLKHGKGTAA